MNDIPMILHVPHASTKIPDGERSSFLLSDEELAAELLSFTDLYTDELYTAQTYGFARAVIYPVSRIVADPERFPDDREEPMAAHGLGVLYTRTNDGRVLRRLPDARERERLLDAWYRPHHERLAAAVGSAPARAGACLIVDCHSFPSVPFPFEADKLRPRPDICIGTDQYHTPRPLAEMTAGLFRDAGFSVDFNHPFAGTLVPLDYYRRNPSVFSVMIELNRGMYVDERTGSKKPEFERLKIKLGEILSRLKRWADHEEDLRGGTE